MNIRTGFVVDIIDLGNKLLSENGYEDCAFLLLKEDNDIADLMDGKLTFRIKEKLL